ncbi:MAG: MmcQ/YjbR family DNA-binding protein [Reichenbachiella sp.]
MNIEFFRDYCLQKPGVTEDFPFDEHTIVFKVMNKMFALADVDNFEFTNLKCDPELAIQLRETFSCVRPGYHMNKKHWNSVDIDGTVSDQKIFEWVDHSYDMVVQGLTKKDKALLQNIS